MRISLIYARAIFQFCFVMLESMCIVDTDIAVISWNYKYYALSMHSRLEFPTTSVIIKKTLTQSVNRDVFKSIYIVASVRQNIPGSRNLFFGMMIDCNTIFCRTLATSSARKCPIMRARAIFSTSYNTFCYRGYREIYWSCKGVFGADVFYCSAYLEPGHAYEPHLWQSPITHVLLFLGFFLSSL